MMTLSIVNKIPNVLIFMAVEWYIVFIEYLFSSLNIFRKTVINLKQIKKDKVKNFIICYEH